MKGLVYVFFKEFETIFKLVKEHPYLSVCVFVLICCFFGWIGWIFRDQTKKPPSPPPEPPKEP